MDKDDRPLYPKTYEDMYAEVKVSADSLIS